MASLGDDALVRLANPQVLGELEQVARLQGSGRITGLADWIQFGAAKDAADLGRVAGELREARCLVVENPGAVVNVGGDGRAPIDPGTGGRLASFDLSIETRTGIAHRSVEVTTQDEPLSSAFDIKPSLRHAASKVEKRRSAGHPVPGTKDVTIRVTLMLSKKTRKATQIMDASGNYVVQAPDGRRIRHGNLLDDVALHLPNIPRHQLLDRVTLVDARTGGLLAVYEQDASVWKRIH